MWLEQEEGAEDTQQRVGGARSRGAYALSERQVEV